MKYNTKLVSKSVIIRYFSMGRVPAFVAERRGAGLLSIAWYEIQDYYINSKMINVILHEKQYQSRPSLYIFFYMGRVPAFVAERRGAGFLSIAWKGTKDYYIDCRILNVILQKKQFQSRSSINMYQQGLYRLLQLAFAKMGFHSFIVPRSTCRFFIIKKNRIYKHVHVCVLKALCDKNEY